MVSQRQQGTERGHSNFPKDSVGYGFSGFPNSPMLPDFAPTVQRVWCLLQDLLQNLSVPGEPENLSVPGELPVA